MDFDDRLVLFVLGCLIGSVVGYIVRLLQETREKIIVVDEHVQDTHHDPHDERGFITFAAIKKNLLTIILVGVAAWAAFSTQSVNNNFKSSQDELVSTQAELKKAQDRIEHVVSCTSFILTKAITALNERTTYSGAQADANVELQKAQAEMLDILTHEPPYSDAEKEAALQAYLDAQDRFFELAKKAGVKVDENDYPTKAEFETCLEAPN